MSAYFEDGSVTLHLGDALEVSRSLEDGCADCIVTSPPYFGLRDYGVEGQYGLEASPAEYVETMRRLFSELRRVLADDGTFWLNIGDSYVGNALGRNDADRDFTGGGGNRLGSGNPGKQGRHNGRATQPSKNLLGIPWRVAFALQDDGWILRNAIIWNKPNAMPESVTDRLSCRYEHVFLFSKSRKYWFDLDPIREPCTTQHAAAMNWARDTKESDVPGQVHRQHRLDRTPYAPGMNPMNIKAATGKQHLLPVDHPGTRNPGDVWSIPTAPFPGAHFACFPLQLPQRCILAGCKPGGTVLDPFNGSGTTGLAALRTGRKYVGVDINREYLDLTLKHRLAEATLDFGEGA